MKNTRKITTIVSLLAVIMAMCAACLFSKGQSFLSVALASTPTDAENEETEFPILTESEIEILRDDDNTTEATTEKKTEKENTENTTSDSTTEATTEATTSSINAAEVAALTSEYKKIVAEKNEVQEKLNYILESQNDFITRLHELDDMIIEYQEKIDDIDAKTDNANEMLIKLEKDVEIAEEKQQRQYELVKNHIRDEYENGSYTYLDAIFEAVDYTDIVNKTEYIQAIETYDEQVLTEYVEASKALGNRKLLLETLTEDMETLRTAYESRQETLQVLSDEKEKQINSYQASIDEMQAELDSIEELEAQQSAKISQIEASYNVSVSINGSTGNAIYTGDDFLWPMPTSTTISSYFGPRVAPTAGATTDHKGIDIPCALGSEVIAVASGTVIYVGYLGNGGNCVIVDHGGGISTCYFHLSSFAVEVNDTVSAGQVICYSGNTGVSTGPHLHFAVRENGTYVNPLKYYKNVKDKSTETES